VTGGRVVFGEVISIIVGAALPVDDELALTDADPVIAHVDGFGTALLDCVIGHAGCGAVVGLDTRRELGMAHFNKRGPERSTLLAVLVKTGEFSLSGAGENWSCNFAEDMDRAVERRWSVVGFGCFIWVQGSISKKMVAGTRERASDSDK